MVVKNGLLCLPRQPSTYALRTPKGLMQIGTFLTPHYVKAPYSASINDFVYMLKISLKVIIKGNNCQFEMFNVDLIPLPS